MLIVCVSRFPDASLVEFQLCSFLFHDTASTELYTLSLHDALPILPQPGGQHRGDRENGQDRQQQDVATTPGAGGVEQHLGGGGGLGAHAWAPACTFSSVLEARLARPDGAAARSEIGRAHV